MQKSQGTRHGKHREEKVQFGGMVTPHFKALAQLTASRCGCSLMDLMMKGIEHYATLNGIMVNGQVSPEYREAVDSLADIIRVNLMNKRKGA